jgi:CheY-like chemotaxis protein
MRRDTQELRKPAPPPLPSQLVDTRVLIVDDNRPLAKTWRLLLAQFGAAVTIKGDVPSSMRAIRQHADNLHVILLD